MNSNAQSHVPILIIGGGVQGVFIANAIRNDPRFRDSVWILDPNPHLLHFWIQDTEHSKVQFLRSSISHSIAPDFHNLRRFAQERAKTNKLSEQEFIHLSYQERENFDILGSYLRPSIKLFNSHAHWYIQETGLEEYHIKGKSLSIDVVKSGGYSVLYEKDGTELELHASKIILAIGQSRENNPQRFSVLSHVPYNIDKKSIHKRELHILGGGLSGSQLAIWALDSGASKVVLYDKENPRFSRFDFDPCYVGPKCKTNFDRIQSSQTRLQISQKNRYPGSLPWEMYEIVKKRIAESTLNWNRTDMYMEPMSFLSTMNSDHKRLGIIATGFNHSPIQLGPWMSSLPQLHGYPLLDQNHRWHKDLFLVGGRSLTAAGPAAGNIIGGHLAVRKILPLIQSA